MNGPQTLLEYEERWTTDVGKWFPGERVVLRGKDLHHELRDVGWIAMLLLAVTGRSFSAEQVRLFEAFCTLTISYPDPSIWPNQVAALAATARSTGMLGAGAAAAVLEAKIFGGAPIIGSIDFLVRAQKRLSGGADLVELVKIELRETRGIPGFGRPIIAVDERIAPVLALARELGLADGPHLKLLFAVHEALIQLHGSFARKPNIAALMGALAADQGLSPRELYGFLISGFSIGYVACYVDAEEKPEGALFPLRCSRIQYEGRPRRAWSPAQASRRGADR